MFQRVSYRENMTGALDRREYVGPCATFTMTTFPGSCVYFEQDGKRSRIHRKDAADLLNALRKAIRAHNIAV